MVFSSITFLLYFLPVVLGLYYLFSFSRVLQNTLLLIFSLIFYAWGEPVYIILLLISILHNYIFGMLIGGLVEHDRGDEKITKLLLGISVFLNLAMLGVFKYTGFVVEIINNILPDLGLQDPEIRLPIGISFYTFQAMSYVIDVYRGDADRQKNPFDLALYISFFPQLVAGPIVRYTTIEDQIKNRKTTMDMFVSGVCRFAEGLIKKILLANNLAIVADNIFALTYDKNALVGIPVMLAWVGAFAYMFQIYFDFSAYSDMAIGLGRMFGFEFEENFRYPFVAKSMREFMTRWHISLAAWFSSYVYKPLGGSRGENQDRMVRNLFIVWLLTGIWHGAAWTFVWWGLYYFIFIIAEMIIGIDKMEGHDRLRHVYVIIAVLISMVIFRSESSEQMVVYFKSMFGFTDKGIFSSLAVMFLQEYAVVFIASVICTIPVKDYYEEYIEDTAFGKAVAAGGNFLYVTFIPLMLIFCLAILEKGSYNPFIYFNF